MRRLAQSEIALSALAVCLLFFVHAVGLPMVLCIAGTGHIAVEALDSPCCSREAAAPPGLYAGDAECDGCTDVPIESISQTDDPRTTTQPVAFWASTKAMSPVPPRVLAGLPFIIASRITPPSVHPPLLRC